MFLLKDQSLAAFSLLRWKGPCLRNSDFMGQFEDSEVFELELITKENLLILTE